MGMLLRSVLTVSIFGIAAAGMPACGGDNSSSGSGGSGGDGTSIQQAQLAQIADIYCNLILSCGCGVSYEDELACFIDIYTLLLDIGNPSTIPPDEPLAFDQECYDRWLETAQNADCELSNGLPACEERCSVFYGTRYLGTPCTDIGGGASVCTRGLQCIGGECRDPCVTSDGPVTCLDGWCPEGQFCDQSVNLCIEIPGLGPCQTHNDCALGLRCIAGHCSVDVHELEGSDCSEFGTCAFGLACENGVCVSEAPVCGAIWQLL